jgi:hypothetical protein
LPSGAASGSASASASTSASPSASAASFDRFAPFSWPFDCEDTTSTPQKGKSVGHTSVVFKIELSNGKKAAWKPNAKKVKGRYKGEIAAFRLAKALGVERHVLPACLRVFDKAATKNVLTEDGKQLLEDEGIAEEGGKISGATIMWLDGLEFYALEKDPLRSDVKAWLTTGKLIPLPKVAFAKSVSTLIAFDFITGNWDRYSGENVGKDKRDDTLLFIDNDAAFMEQPPKEALARNKAMVEGTDRFSKSFVASMRGLVDNESKLEEVLGATLLSKTVLKMVSQRGKELLAIIDAKIEKKTEAETLYFP